jgi:HEAT repeat protein
MRRLRLIGGTEVVAALLQSAREDPSEEVRLRAARYLGDIRAPEAVPLLAERWRSGKPGAKQYGVTLAYMGGPQAFQALTEALGDPDERVVEEACEWFALFGQPAEQPLRKMLEHPVWWVREAACRSLLLLNAGDGLVASVLQQLLQQPEAQRTYHREWLEREVQRLTGTGPGDEALRQADLEAALADLKDTDPEVRAEAARRLAELEDQRAVPSLVNALDDASTRVRFAAALALWHLEPPEAVPAFIERVRTDPSWDVRAMCASYLGWHGNEQVVEVLIEALKDENESVQKAAIGSLGRIGDERAIPSLLPRLGHNDWRVRYQTAFALLSLKAADPRLVAALERLAAEPESEEHDLEVEEWNCNLERHRELARETGDEEPEPRQKIHELLEEARRLLIEGDC